MVVRDIGASLSIFPGIVGANTASDALTGAKTKTSGALPLAGFVERGAIPQSGVAIFTGQLNASANQAITLTLSVEHSDAENFGSGVTTVATKTVTISDDSAINALAINEGLDFNFKGLGGYIRQKAVLAFGESDGDDDVTLAGCFVLGGFDNEPAPRLDTAALLAISLA